MDRPLTTGQTTPSLSTKSSRAQVNETALNALQNAPFAKALQGAFRAGKFIVIANNGHGLLNDPLVYKLFGVTDPVENHNSGLIAIGIFNPGGNAHPIPVAFYSNNPHSINLNDIARQATKYYPTLKQEGISPSSTKISNNALSTTSATASSTGTVSSNGGTMQGSGNYWYYNNLYDLYDGDSLIGELKMWVQLQRTYTNNTNYSVWEVKMNDSTSDQENSADAYVESNWASVTNNYTSSQSIVQEGPASTNPSKHTSTTEKAQVDMSPETGGSGQVTYETTWSYDVPAVSVSANYNGYSSAWWQHDYAAGSPAADSSFNYAPGVVVTNNAGPMVLTLDDVLSMWDYYANGTVSTGDRYDTLQVNDLA